MKWPGVPLRVGKCAWEKTILENVATVPHELNCCLCQEISESLKALSYTADAQRALSLVGLPVEADGGAGESLLGRAVIGTAGSL